MKGDHSKSHGPTGAFPVACSLMPQASPRVMATSDSTGALLARKYQDAFGNRQTGWTGSAFSGLWSPAGGWGHNTKETDAFTNMVYMYQRWNEPATGRFMSRAPYQPEMEAAYSFTQDPVFDVDPSGKYRQPGGEIEARPPEPDSPEEQGLYTCVDMQEKIRKYITKCEKQRDRFLRRWGPWEGEVKFIEFWSPCGGSLAGAMLVCTSVYADIGGDSKIFTNYIKACKLTFPAGRKPGTWLY